MRSPFATALVPVVLAFYACASVAPDVQVLGDYRLTYSEVRQIKDLVSQLPMRRSVSHITTLSTARVVVFCDAISPRGDERIVFTALRRGGRWVIDRSSIHKEQMIVLD